MTKNSRYLAIRKILLLLSHQAMPFMILPAFMILLVAGTIAQRYMSLHEAQMLFFSGFFLWLGPVPLPSGGALLLLLTAGLLVKFLFFSRWSWSRAGTHLAHLGMLVLLLGGLLTIVQAEEGFMLIAEGQESAIIHPYPAAEGAERTEQTGTLPYTIRLVDFVKENHPGTVMPSRYSSHIIVRDGKTEWPVLIAMNEPLRYRGYTLFQSSFKEDGAGGEASILAVVKNEAWLYPYVGTGLMALGLLFHFILSMTRRSAP